MVNNVQRAVKNGKCLLGANLSLSLHLTSAFKRRREGGREVGNLLLSFKMKNVVPVKSLGDYYDLHSKASKLYDKVSFRKE